MIYGRHVNKYYLKYWYMFLIGIVALILVDYFQLLIPDIIGDVVDNIDNKTMTFALLKEYMLQFLIVALVMFVGRFLWRITIFGVGLKIETDLREKMFDKSLLLSQNYYSNNKTGAIMALYTNDLQAIRQTFGMGTIMIIDVLFLGTFALVKMIKLNLLLSIISAIPMLLLALMSGVIGKYMNKKYEDRQKSYENLSDFSQETFSGINVIKAFILEAKELIQYKKLNKDNALKNITYIKFAVMLDILISLVINSIFIIIALYGGYLVFKSMPNNILLTAGELTKFISYFDTLIWPMMAIAQVINLRSQGKASLNRINELLNEKIDIRDINTKLLNNVSGKITFNNFNFQYPDTNIDVLKNITFTINPGEKVGIIGKTGSGKTTLVDILLRIYNVNQNEVFIDDIDIMNICYKQVRDIVAYVPQDNFLFSDTIKNNIGFSKKNIDLDDVKKYAKYASISDNIEEFKDQYDTLLGERGSTISGGQKQRISIARALYKDAPILILDDSTSAVDTKTEEEIINNLNQIRKDKTTILIAHRISTVKRLDKIIVIDDGKIAGIGNHFELLSNCKIYKDLVLLQKLEEEVDNEEI